MMTLATEARASARFVVPLRGYLRNPLRTDQALAIVHARLRDRAADFLSLVRRAVYGNPTSPYRTLLSLAGCEYGDLERLVMADGLESALSELYRSGVYLTVEEFKGRRQVVRGSRSLEVNAVDLRNPGSAHHLLRASSGSRGAATVVPLDFRHLRDRAATAGAYLSAHQDGTLQYALWTPPGSFAMVHMLQFSGHGDRPSAWFWQVDPATLGLHHRYMWSARVLRWGSVLAGAPLPVPEVVPTDAPIRVARWLADAVQRGRTPFLLTYVTAGVNLCRAALEAGIDLRGAKLLVTGEPITAPRAEAIRQAGAQPVPDYGSAETGLVGYGCLQPEAPDDVHLFTDLHAMIQVAPGDETGTLRPGALLISSLRDTTSLIFINVSMGDAAVVSHRSCTCPVEQIGWTTHLHTIRSFEKLTAAGVTFLDVDVARVLDEILPARFGGGPGDYQLVEREGRDGQTFLHLLVHPRLGALNERDVAEEFLRAVGQGSGGERLAAELWRETGILSVRSEPPLRTRGGKVLHLHVDGR